HRSQQAHKDLADGFHGSINQLLSGEGSPDGLLFKKALRLLNGFVRQTSHRVKHNPDKTTVNSF
ncbi:MAG: hypothetical protein WCP45_14510, partial [Verrucomicrobiota bacterium]